VVNLPFFVVSGHSRESIMVNSLHDRLRVELAHGRWINSLALAELWLAIGDRTQAREQVLAAYRNAWVDGEPYVWRYELNKTCTL
jgi:hypothetical protein